MGGSRYSIIYFHSIQLSVIGDDLNVSNMQPDAHRQIRKVAKCVVHPGFQRVRYFENDIAIVIVDAAFIETFTFEPMRLQITGIEPVKDNERCQIGKLFNIDMFEPEITRSFAFLPMSPAGWGVYDNLAPEPITSFNLRTVNVSVVPYSKCNEIYTGFLHSKVFCAGHTEPGICFVNSIEKQTHCIAQNNSIGRL